MKEIILKVFPKIVFSFKNISKYTNTCYIRRKSSRPRALHCLGGGGGEIIFVFRRQILAVRRSGSNLVWQLTVATTPQFDMYYTHIRTWPRYVSISDLAEIESATVGGIRKRKRKRESTTHSKFLSSTRFVAKDNRSVR